jgi:adenosylcobyric acid synthase
VFDLPQACNALLDWAGYQTPQAVDFNALREAGINKLADCLAENFDFAELDAQIERFHNS